MIVQYTKLSAHVPFLSQTQHLIAPQKSPATVRFALYTSAEDRSGTSSVSQHLKKERCCVQGHNYKMNVLMLSLHLNPKT